MVLYLYYRLKGGSDDSDVKLMRGLHRRSWGSWGVQTTPRFVKKKINQPEIRKAEEVEKIKAVLAQKSSK